MPSIQQLLASLGIACVAVAAIHAALTLVAVLIWRLRHAPPRPAARPPVTVLKPLCGAEPGLYEHLRSFCLQDHPEFQIVFGVRDRADPAVAVVERLAAEFPSLAIELVINPQQHGTNLKVSSLINMIGRARHDVLVMADSDTFVTPDYLECVTAPLLNRKVGLVTTLYRGVPTAPVWSRLGAMYINDWYMPSVLLAWLFGHEGYVSGQTMCLRRETLEALGGLQSIADHLADDHRLGELVRALGLRIVLSPYVPTAEHHEPDRSALIHHEVRWMRTICVLRPHGFRMMFLSFDLPLALVGLALAAVDPAAWNTAAMLFLVPLAARLILHLLPRGGRDLPLLSDVWLVPARDLLIVWVWIRAFFASRITWRGNEFDVGADGVMRRLS